MSFIFQVGGELVEKTYLINKLLLYRIRQKKGDFFFSVPKNT